MHGWGVAPWGLTPWGGDLEPDKAGVYDLTNPHLAVFGVATSLGQYTTSPAVASFDRPEPLQT